MVSADSSQKIHGKGIGIEQKGNEEETLVGPRMLICGQISVESQRVWRGFAEMRCVSARYGRVLGLHSWRGCVAAAGTVL